ncbi:hypothetical protein CYLTODRAFT_420066 [Cylindrobasidium torrendii FP15055 ss-10]|uniref:Flavin reductase like domain-containing protein n=1 Tax=Cylindrobasidium torrendii FP15055 ss-10 TaxID=1314674 RepID=A0A0D7BIM9_9AGAR|nr:hypothetical protein CYLTODRAFT_420066 [Cylindrobasidium torrendii FP15055 ss-10]
MFSGHHHVAPTKLINGLSKLLVRLTKRPITTSECLNTDFRDLLRRTAQPVAVVTSLLHGHGPSSFHGATLSSFTSIAISPHPIVSFSLIRPSRLAHSLNPGTKFVVNLLASHQQNVAVTFSRADLYPTPFDGSIPFHTTPEGLPVLDGALGALSCVLVAPPIPLHDLDVLEGLTKEKSVLDVMASGITEKVEPPPTSSELFIARVLRVEKDEAEDTSSPLLYRNRTYTTVANDTKL